MRSRKPKGNLELIIEEIAYDLKIDKKVVRKVLTKGFAEMLIALTLKKKSVMIRGFAKLVVSKGLNKNMKLEDIIKLKTKNK